MQEVAYQRVSSTAWLLQRSWEFLVGLTLLDLFPGTLTLVAAFGLVDGLALVVFGGAVGEYVDRCVLMLSVAVSKWFPAAPVH